MRLTEVAWGTPASAVFLAVTPTPAVRCCNVRRLVAADHRRHHGSPAPHGPRSWRYPCIQATGGRKADRLPPRDVVAGSPDRSVGRGRGGGAGHGGARSRGSVAVYGSPRRSRDRDGASVTEEECGPLTAGRSRAGNGKRNSAPASRRDGYRAACASPLRGQRPTRPYLRLKVPRSSPYGPASTVIERLTCSRNNVARVAKRIACGTAISQPTLIALH